ncbi:RICIN domain-containing protein [Streptomyces sp. NBC_00566]|uniref:RICIN domain-containing protein n=1 Tax=Streptomyces sp. NBC_00566 TaxID=2975778 RepID=UPI002E81BF70|nr:RICIN domain-containing protein [Streptomyces sp. NBC_00566]WUB85686.1 RICIN domain-containing protein [Streptomyces sp. NBC_00566]
MSARSAVRRTTRCLCAVTLGAAATLAAAPQAAAASDAVSPGRYRIVTYSDLCWDSGGAQLTQETCAEENADQVFELMPSYDRVEQRVRTADGECLEVDGFYVHDAIRGQGCDWDSHDQLFRFVSLGNGKYQIKPDAHAGKCADVEYPTAQTDVTSSPCRNSDLAENQQFKLVRMN